MAIYPLHLWYGLQQGPVLDSFKHIVQEYNVEHSNAPVELKDFSDYGAPAREALSASMENQPQLVLAPEFMTGKMKAALKERRVIPMDTLIDAELLRKMTPLVKRTFGDSEGNLASLPFNPACGVLYSNAQLLQAVGRDPAFSPQTVEELDAVCKELIEKGLVEAGYTCAWPAAYLVEVPAAQQDLPLAEPENGALGFGAYQLSQGWLYNHLLDLRQKVRDKVFVYSGRDNNARKPFTEKKVAFFMQGSTHHPLLQKEASFPVGCAPLPILMRGQRGKYAFPLGGAALWALDNPQTRQMVGSVRTFLNYLASEKIQERWHQETAYAPVAWPEKLEKEGFYQDHPLHRAVVEQTVKAPMGKYSFGIHMPNYDEARKGLVELIEKALDVKNTSDEQVKVLLKEFDEKFSVKA